MDEILMLQEEIGELQTCFSEELGDNDNDGEPGDQLALHSTVTVLGERMATIRMKASGKRQLLEVSDSFYSSPSRHDTMNCRRRKGYCCYS